MLLISNHAKAIGMEYPPGAVIRINLAWVRTIDEVKKVIAGADGHKIFCDFPNKRQKPPGPSMSLMEAINLCKELQNSISYFAFSNAEDRDMIDLVRLSMPTSIKLVPKIETKFGVDNIKIVMQAAQSDVIMLDKEDLYVSCNANPNDYNAYVSRVRDYCHSNNIKCLELNAVIFSA